MRTHTSKPFSFLSWHHIDWPAKTKVGRRRRRRRKWNRICISGLHIDLPPLLLRMWADLDPPRLSSITILFLFLIRPKLGSFLVSDKGWDRRRWVAEERWSSARGTRSTFRGGGRRSCPPSGWRSWRRLSRGAGGNSSPGICIKMEEKEMGANTTEIVQVFCRIRWILLGFLIVHVCLIHPFHSIVKLNLKKEQKYFEIDRKRSNL